MKVAVLTHTGSDMPLWESEKLQIKIIPDYVIFGGHTYKNMYDISATEFYERLSESKELPTTSHPTVGALKDYFREASENADQILFLSITSKMSGSYLAAVSARDELVNEGIKTPIYVYDTLQCSHGVAQMVREASSLANDGKNAEEIMTELDEYRNKIGVYFILNTLHYASKGGRVGAIKALAADKMGIKPLLIFENGVCRDYGIARTFQDGMQKTIEKYEKEADFTKTVTVFHGAADDKAEYMVNAIKSINPDQAVRIEYVGPVIGVYTGPGVAGMAFVRK